MMNFRSDNEAPIASSLLEAIAQANVGCAAAYGEDDWSTALQGQFSTLFERSVATFPVVTGTAANALSLAHLSPSYGAIICHQRAHAQVDECGAPEFYSGGAKLYPLPGANGKLSADTVEQAIAGLQGHHAPTPAVLTLTQATECGTVYTPDEIAQLSAVAHQHGMAVHMDGARFANAVAHLSCQPAQLTWRCGVDVLSFGATKNGAMGAEAVIFFKPEQSKHFALRLLKGGHLLSKSRFIATQLQAYVRQKLWLELAKTANAAARRAARALDQVPSARILFPVEANEIFVCLPADLDHALRQAGFSYRPWPGEPGLCRLVFAYNAQAEHLARFEQVLKDYGGRQG